MKLRILGCSGGIGSNLRTTSMLLDHDVLIDAGTGVGDLDLQALSKIDHVFLTHSHLDHIVSIPFMLDSVAAERARPLQVYALAETIDVLKRHIFNWEVWPDFSQIPDTRSPYLEYRIVSVGDSIDLDGRCITVLPADHVVPAVGYSLSSGRGALVYSGDTTLVQSFWDALNRIQSLKYLIIETAFPNADAALARVSKHLCPSMLAEGLSNLHGRPEVYITHVKPGADLLTMGEIRECVQGFQTKMLVNEQVFEF